VHVPNWIQRQQGIYINYTAIMGGLNVTFMQLVKLWQPLCGWYVGSMLSDFVENTLARRLSNYVSRHPDVAREVARRVARNVTTHNAIHRLNTKIIMALSVAERHNLKLAFVMCSRSTAYLLNDMLFLFISFVPFKFCHSQGCVSLYEKFQ
jgi:hypothetical protein